MYAANDFSDAFFAGALRVHRGMRTCIFSFAFYTMYNEKGFVVPDLGPDCFQRLSADGKSRY